jgi:hypothetical protein
LSGGLRIRCTGGDSGAEGKKIQLFQLRILEFLTLVSLVLVPVEVKEKTE